MSQTCRPLVDVLVVCVLSAAAAGARAESGRARPRQDRPPALDAQVAWRVSLPLGFTARIDSYHLVDGVLFAIGTDGRVRAIDAATGLYLWGTDVAPASQRIRGPELYRGSAGAPERSAVFTTFTQAVFVDFATGQVHRRVRLHAAPTASVDVFDESIFLPAVNSRVWLMGMDAGSSHWQVGTRGPVRLSPLYLPEQDILVVADDEGFVHGVTMDRHKLYTRELGGEPRGWIASDASTLYIATGGDVPQLHALDRISGEPVREPYRLQGQPACGPVVTRTAVYQPLARGGVHCIGLSPEVASWFNPHGRQFLAEWPGRTAILRTGGTVECVEHATRRPVGVFEAPAEFSEGVSNPLNDLAVVATQKGEVWCLRPAQAPPVDVASFHVAASQPTTRPVHTRPASAGPATILTYRPASATPAAPRTGGQASGGFGAVAAPRFESRTIQSGRGGPPRPRERRSQRGRVEDQLNRALGR